MPYFFPFSQQNNNKKIKCIFEIIKEGKAGSKSFNSYQIHVDHDKEKKCFQTASSGTSQVSGTETKLSWRHSQCRPLVYLNSTFQQSIGPPIIVTFYSAMVLDIQARQLNSSILVRHLISNGPANQMRLPISNGPRHPSAPFNHLALP